jgi:hypothetical protein
MKKLTVSAAHNVSSKNPQRRRRNLIRRRGSPAAS